LKSFVCGIPCPKCGFDVQSYGNSCYPEEGISIECTNLECDYNLEIKVNHTIPLHMSLHSIAQHAHNELWYNEIKFKSLSK